MTVLLEEKSDEDVFQTTQTVTKAHLREIVGVEYVRDPLTKAISLVTCAHDSVKFWSVSEDGGQISEEREIKGWRCGVQAFDITSDGKLIAVVGTDSTLHQILMSNKATSAHIEQGDRIELDGVKDVDFLEGSEEETVAGSSSRNKESRAKKDFVMESFNNGHREIWHICISHDRSTYLTVSFSGALTILDLSGKVVKSASFNAVRQICGILYSPDAKTIALAHDEGVVTILDASNLASRYFFEAHTLKVRAMCFSHNSKNLLTGSDDKMARLYDISGTKPQLIRSFCGHLSCITALRFDRCTDGKRFASCSNDGTVRLWDTTDGHILHVFRNCHDGVVKNLAFSLDNQYIATVGEDRAVCIHRVANGERFVADSSSGENNVRNQDYRDYLYNEDSSNQSSMYYLSAVDYRPGCSTGNEYVPTAVDNNSADTSRSYHSTGS